MARREIFRLPCGVSEIARDACPLGRRPLAKYGRLCRVATMALPVPAASEETRQSENYRGALKRTLDALRNAIWCRCFHTDAQLTAYPLPHGFLPEIHVEALRELGKRAIEAERSCLASEVLRLLRENCSGDAMNPVDVAAKEVKSELLPWTPEATFSTAGVIESFDSP